MAEQAVQRIAMIYRVEHEAREMSVQDRLAGRRVSGQPLWDEFFVWLKLERSRVAEGSAIAKALDYSINLWAALTAHLHDGRLPVDNNHLDSSRRFTAAPPVAGRARSQAPTPTRRRSR